jgi:hypothetical protein
MTTNETGRAAAANLPWPAPWGQPKAVSGLVWTVFFALLAVGGLVAGVSLLLPGPIDPRVFALVALIPLFSGLSLIWAVTRLRVRSRSARPVRSQDGALSIPFSLTLWVALWLTFGGCLLFDALLVAFVWLVAFAPSPPDVVPLVVGVLLVLLALPFVGLVVDGLRGKAVRGELLVSAQGIRYRALAYDVELGWDSVERVSVVGGDGQRIVILAYNNMTPSVQGRSWLSKPGKAVLEQAAEATVVVRGAALSISPALAFHTLRYYQQNPAARVELGTDAAVQRVRSAAVLP